MSTDARTLAKEIAVAVSGYEHDWPYLQQKIESALRRARNEALEEAAKVADEDMADAERRMADANPEIGAALLHVYATGERIAVEIRRAKKDESDG